MKTPSTLFPFLFPFLFLFLFLFPFLFLRASAQEDSAIRERTFGKSVIAAFDNQPDSTIYSALHQVWNADLPLSYVSLPMIGMYTKSIERVGPLIEGEGKNGYILEGVMDLNFILVQGRRQNKHWYQTLRLAFKYAPAVRMTRDNSSNLLPTNQKVGFQLDKVLWDSYTRIFFTESRGKTEAQERRNFFSAKDTPLHSVSFGMMALHFSNGMPAGVYRSVDSARNDYIKGDFSTNLLQPSFTYNYYSRNKSLLSVKLGYQWDGNWFGPFSFIEEQKKRYGQHRIVGHFQYRSPPNRHSLWKPKNVRGRDGHDYYIYRMWEFRARWEYEYILDDLSLYKRSKDYRFNWHLYFELQPMRSRTVGYFAHVYRGRDYFNIRYDDILWIFQAGLTFTINRYQNPRFHPHDAIKARAEEPNKFFRQQQEQRTKGQ